MRTSIRPVIGSFFTLIFYHHGPNHFPSRVFIVNKTMAKILNSSQILSVKLYSRLSSEITIKRSYALRKRFYRKTGVLYNDGKYEITLDQRKLKTPNGNLFTVNSEPLALAVAAEWNLQKEKIKQSTMHLTTLCNTVIDNPNKLMKYDMVQYILNYLETDSVLFQSHENDELYQVELEEWDPVIQWFCDRFQVNLRKSRSMNAPIVHADTKESISRHLMSYNFDCVHGYVYAVDTLKSVILAVACSERFISPEKAALLSRLEEEFQLKKWGRVVWSHDLNQQDQQARLSATILFIYFNSTSWLTKSKDIS